VEALTKAVLPVRFQSLLQASLPDWVKPFWWENAEQLVELAPQAEIGWFDMLEKAAPLKAICRASRLKWLNTAFAGVDWLPLGDLEQRGVKLTNGSGINAIAVAEFAIMSMLAQARGYAEIVRAQDSKAWLHKPQARRQLAGSRALVMGYGAIGRAIGGMLEGLQVEVTPMRRSGGQGVLGPEGWRDRLSEFDWIILTLPGTPETTGMIGAGELAKMKDEGVLVNFARAEIVDQAALVAALQKGEIGGAILDVTDPEPLPPNHELWDCPGMRITMHAAGAPTTEMLAATAARFVKNCHAYREGTPLEAQVDLALGY